MINEVSISSCDHLVLHGSSFSWLNHSLNQIKYKPIKLPKCLSDWCAWFTSTNSKSIEHFTLLLHVPNTPHNPPCKPCVVCSFYPNIHSITDVYFICNDLGFTIKTDKPLYLEIVFPDVRGHRSLQVVVNTVPFEGRIIRSSFLRSKDKRKGRQQHRWALDYGLH